MCAVRGNAPIEQSLTAIKVFSGTPCSAGRIPTHRKTIVYAVMAQKQGIEG